MGYKAISRLFQDCIDQLRILFSRRQRVLITGLGRIGSQKVLDHEQDDHTVIAFEIAVPDHHSRMIQDQGVIVLREDVTDPETFPNYIARKPACVYLVTGDDLNNMNALAILQQSRQKYHTDKKRSAGKCDCFSHIHYAARLLPLQPKNHSPW